ncbi:MULTISPECIES: CDP-diacylglycerol diphosphatase [Providencia]|uniref:CDP-diacylglycerol diphosphatase n=1 Tax=Providencia TaxID=586 RepID=UPI0012B515B1|nr:MULTISPECIES: CDP-diacylglycerol diphosphatase [Providencia]MTC70598.1 CDP-diacylglycerol diphosphatase [Providencia sp. wls1914]QLR04607.1 CDP-diacylglycerol diphosphatase [Providencia rettgeri]
MQKNNNTCKKKLIKIIAAVVLLLLLSVIGYISWIKYHADGLWNIISQQCIAINDPDQRNPSCLKVDLDNRYVLFKDKKGPVHNLVLPTDKVSGIESPLLLEDNSPDYFTLAWNERESVSPAGQPAISDDKLALAINSQYGRSQDQLHIHIACLKPQVIELVNQHADAIKSEWHVFPVPLEGHEYWVKKLDSQQSPFKQLNEYVQAHNDSMGNYGLAVTELKDGSMVLLANRTDVWQFNLGSAGELLDYQCSVNQ